MKLFKLLAQDKCPKCQKTLQSKSGAESKMIVTKFCLDGHYEKEFHPALETYVVTKVS